MCTACGKARWFVRGSPAESRIAYDLVSGAFHAWKLPRPWYLESISVESDFEMEDVWEEGDDGDYYGLITLPYQPTGVIVSFWCRVG